AHQSMMPKSGYRFSENIMLQQIRRSAMQKHNRIGTFATALALAVALPALAAQSMKIDFANDAAGGDPNALVSVVGVWRVESADGKNVLAVDGRKWKHGQSSAGIAEKARALYGERYAEFLDRVQAFAYFPYMVVKEVPDFKAGEITVRFEGLSGRID